MLDRSVKAFHFFRLSGCFFQGSYVTCKVPALEADDPDDPLLLLRDFYGSAASLRDPLYFPRSFLFSHFFSFLPFIKLAYCPEGSDSKQDVYPEQQGYVFSCKDAENYCYVLFQCLSSCFRLIRRLFFRNSSVFGNIRLQFWKCCL